MRRLTAPTQRGQSLVVVALFLTLVFMAMGLAIDGGMVYTQRRLMQNSADAACLAAANQLALGQSDATARTRAEQVIAQNIGPSGPGTGANAPGTLAYAAIADVYAANGTSGDALTRGIEISGADVRVALQSPATTFFLRVAGIERYTVSARARCNSTAGGGASPFAVVRWRGFEQANSTDTDDMVSGGPTTELALPQQYRHHGNQYRDMTVRDILRAEGSSVISEWPGWGSANYPGDPAGDVNDPSDAGLYSTPPENVRASDANPGFETVIAGEGANSNEPSNTSFSGPVVLDYRQTTFPQPLFYNGLSPDTALQQYKDRIAQYVLGPYPGPHVIPGQQLGFHSGVSAGLVEKPFDLRYNVGDTVTVLVYNGTIYEAGQSFRLVYPTSADSFEERNRDSFTGSCTESDFESDEFDGLSSDPETRKPAARYSIRVTPDVFSRYKLRAFLSTDAASWGELQGSWNGNGWANFDINGAGPVVSVSPGGSTLTLDVRPSTTTECTTIDETLGITSTLTLPTRQNGAQTLYLEARDEATGKRRAVYALLNMNAESDDFYVYIPGELSYQPLQPRDNPPEVPFVIETVSGNVLRASDVSFGDVEWFATSDLTAPVRSGATHNGVTVAVTSQAQGAPALDIDVSDSASTGREYYIRIPVSYRGQTHYFWYYIAVQPSLNNSASINQYVYALGYARFRITDISSNEIRGRAVSGLLRPEEIREGMLPRLVAWED